jgi:hypothetical protein
MVYHAALDGGNGETSGSIELFTYVMNGLKQSHIQYFRYWDHLLDLEASAEADSTVQGKWRASGAVLQYIGEKCIGNVNVGSIEKKIHDCYELKLNLPKFLKKDSDAEISDDSAKHFAVGDHVIISVDKITSNDCSRSIDSSLSYDIEDLIKDAVSPKITVEPNICGGIIKDISESHLIVTLKQTPKRLLKLWYVFF